MGHRCEFKIIKVNPAEKKIGLSLRAVVEEEERAGLEQYQQGAAAATSTIEEVLTSKEREES
jgi:small subunit ribosomal protein S1